MNRSDRKIRRYAKALIEVAGKEGAVDDVSAELASVRRWLDGTPAFHVFTVCGRIGGREERLRTVLELAHAAGFSRLTGEFLAQVEAGRDLEGLGEILDEFDRLQRVRSGIVSTEVVSAHPLTGEQKSELTRRLSRRSGGKSLDISFKEDPEILGGFVARMGEEIHDYSVSGRLARLRRQLMDA